MCDSNVGVAKKLDLEAISKDISDLIKKLDREASGPNIDVPVPEVKRISKKLEEIIK